MILEFFHWWYGPGWVLAFRRAFAWASGVEQSFSLLILIRTLFAPWRRIVSLGGRGLDVKIRAMLDNAVSRIVGFCTRSIVIVAALFSISGVFILGLLLAIVWPLLPLAVAYCAVKGITG